MKEPMQLKDFSKLTKAEMIKAYKFSNEYKNDLIAIINKKKARVTELIQQVADLEQLDSDVLRIKSENKSYSKDNKVYRDRIEKLKKEAVIANSNVDFFREECSEKGLLKNQVYISKLKGIIKELSEAL